MFLINPYILQASGNPLWDGLQAYYTADNTPNDALGTYNGTLTNGATYGTGIINNGFSFDGVNDYVDLGNNLDFDGSTPFSFSCWIKPNTAHTSSIISKKGGSPTYTGYRFIFKADQIQLALNADASTGDALYVSTGAATISSGVLSMVTVTYDGSKDASGVTFYINGLTSAKTIITNNLTGSISNTTSAKIGFMTGLLNAYNGIIDEVGVWDKELSASEVTELYNSGAGKQYPTGIDAVWSDLLAYYTADNTPNDALGNFNGTLVNGATYGTGIISNGFSLDGVNDYIDLPNGSFAPTGDFSLSCWCYFDTITGWVLNFGDYSTTEGIVLYIASNKMTGLVADGAFQITQGTTTLSTSTWYHVVFTSSSTNGTNLYLNNSVDKSLPLNTKTPTYGATEFARIGARANNSNYVNGIIDEVALFEKELSASEVTELYNSGAGKQYPN